MECRQLDEADALQYMKELGVEGDHQRAHPHDDEYLGELRSPLARIPLLSAVALGGRGAGGQR